MLMEAVLVPGEGWLWRIIAELTAAWISGFGGFIGHSDNLHVELLAIPPILSLYHAISLVLGPTLEFHRYATIVQDIKDLLLLQWDVRLLHTLHKGNHCADCLAKMGASSDEPFTHL